MSLLHKQLVNKVNHILIKEDLPKIHKKHSPKCDHVFLIHEVKPYS